MTSKNYVIYIFILISILTIYLFSFDRHNYSIVNSIKPLEREEIDAIKIIATGDSLTEGFGLPTADAYPAQLEKSLNALGLNVFVINEGMSGETSQDNLERVETISKQNPDIVLLGIGGNDALRKLSIEKTEENITNTIKALRSGTNPPIVVLLQMQAHINGGLSYKKQFDEIYEKIAKTNQVMLIPFLTTEVFLESDNKLRDGIHLNQRGYAEVVKLYLVPELTPLLEKLRE